MAHRLAVHISSFAFQLASGAVEYDERSALTYAEYARVSFCIKDVIEDWECGDMCELSPTPAERVFIEPGPRYGVQGYVAQASPADQSGGDFSDDSSEDSGGVSCILALRGTANFNARNILADALFWRRAWPPGGAEWCEGCAVHFGYAAAYAELRPNILAAVRQLNCSSVAMAGHSLGASLVTLASFDFRAGEGLRVESVWAFGKPRIGNAQFAEAYAQAARLQGVDPPLWRVVHRNDIIPRLPPYAWGYRHEALEVYYPGENSSSFRVCPPDDGQFENATCMLATPWYTYDWTLADHCSYLNLTFEETEFNPTCIPVQPPWKPFICVIAVVLMCMCIVCHECCLLRPVRKSRKPKSKVSQSLDKPLISSAA